MYPPGGRATLDGPPPSPAAYGLGMGASPAPPPQGFNGLTSAAAAPQQTAQYLEIGKQIDQALLALAQAMPGSAEEFRQSQAFLQAGLAKGLEAAVPATSATAVGNQFPGGGFGGGLP